MSSMRKISIKCLASELFARYEMVPLRKIITMSGLENDLVDTIDNPPNY